MSHDEPAHTRRLTIGAIYSLLVVIVLVMGLNWPIMSVGVESITPVWFGVFRVGGAAIVVIVMAAATRRLRIPPRADLPIVLSIAVFRLCAVTLLVFTALQIIPPGRSSVIAWTTPLWTVPLAAVFLGERMTRRRWIGLTLGLTGVVVLFEPWGLDWSDLEIALGHALLIVAAMTNAATSVHIRGHKWTVTPLEALPWQLAGASVVMLAIALTIEGPPAIAWTPILVAIVVYEGVLASGVASWAQIVVLRNMNPVSANLTMMGVPAIGVLSSALILGEVISPELGVGLVMITLGVTVNLLADRGLPGRRRDVAGL